jgi:hypothetical protein
MARLTDALLGAKAWSTGNETPQLDPLHGGQFAYATNPAEWVSAQAYVPRNLIPIVLEAPQFFKHMPDSDKWVTAWRVMIEKHARTIEGLKAGLTVEVAEHAFGGGGEFFQEFTDVKRERSTLSIGMVDKYGNVFQNFLERWITYGMMHPETKTPLSATLDGGGPTDNLADWYGGTIAFIEPDPTGKRAVRTWISTNVWPQGTGPIEGKMDKTSALSIKELSLELTSLTFINEGTRAYGQELLTNMQLNWANPQLKESFIKAISPDVAAVTTGYKESIENIQNARVGDLI